MLATRGLLLLQTPPADVSVRVLVVPVHKVVLPPMVPATAAGLTVTDAVEASVPHAFTTEYDMMAEPADTPVTTPVALTVATAALVLLQVPPVAASVKVRFDPTQMLPVDGDTVPALSAGLMVTPAVVKAVAQPVVTV